MAAEYQLTAATEPCAVIRYSDKACVPPDMANRDYNGGPQSPGYLQWVAAGGVPDPYVAPPPPPPFADANMRLDAGISAALVAADEVRDSLHAISGGFNAANFQQFLLQAKILADAFVAMLEAQQVQPPQPP